MALLGEMPKQTGTVSIHGKIGYTAQIPWVFSGTLRHNILFGQPFDKTRYQSVIKYCALEQVSVEVFKLMVSSALSLARGPFQDQKIKNSSE